MRDYVIWTPGYVTHYGGVVVLHRLCHELNMLGGFTAYLWIADGGGVNPGWYTPPLPAGHRVGESIVVYPEIVKDDPLHAQYKVRWLLQRADVPDDGYTVSFSPMISDEDDVFNLNVVDETIWYPPRPGAVRSGGVLWRGKADNRGVPTRKEDKGKTLVTRQWPPTQEELADLFRRSELLVTYDELSAVAVEAALCGCPVLILPHVGYTREDAERGEYGLDGMAWGEADMPRALSTLHRIQETHREIKRTQVDRVREFVRRTQGRWPQESEKAT